MRTQCILFIWMATTSIFTKSPTANMPSVWPRASVKRQIQDHHGRRHGLLDTHYGDPQYANYPVTTCPGATRIITAPGPVKACPPKPNGKRPPAAAVTPHYPWGDTAPDCSLAKYSHQAILIALVNQSIILRVSRDSCVCSWQPPAGASPYGVMDMAGNVAEYVLDWRDNDYYSLFEPNAWPANPINNNDLNHDSSSPKVIRGAGCDSAV